MVHTPPTTPLSAAQELTSLADVGMRTLIRGREMGPDGLPVCQSRDGCFADTIAVNSLTVTLCFYPEALGVCWHILVGAFRAYVPFPAVRD